MSRIMRNSGSLMAISFFFLGLAGGFAGTAFLFGARTIYVICAVSFLFVATVLFVKALIAQYRLLAVARAKTQQSVAQDIAKQLLQEEYAQN